MLKQKKSQANSLVYIPEIINVLQNYSTVISLDT